VRRGLTERIVGVIVVLLGLATAVGLLALWPRADEVPAGQPPADALVAAEVLGVVLVEGAPDPFLEQSSDAGTGTVLEVTARLSEGAEAGRVVTIEVYPEGYPPFEVGDRILLLPADVPGSDVEFFVTDFARLPALARLVGLFVLAVLIVGRWHGLRSLLGLVISLGIVIRFVVPAILAGRPPAIVALVGALAVMLVTLLLTHGIDELTMAAIVGTAGALIVTVTVGMAAIGQAKITGFASEDAVFARYSVPDLDLRGLVLAGLIIAALGVLDDVTVSQASTVFALHEADATQSWGTLFARAMRVGRDHIASVINTLFLAYAGASLALLVLFSTGGLPAGELVNAEVIAEELVKTIVGSLGLIAAVPFTTALAVTLATARDELD
jgi:uncharacterized membrane protein